tara:strand:- start:270 stop:1187 length:918 start_codon:yes stop_codon:yes gene_type:complete
MKYLCFFLFVPFVFFSQNLNKVEVYINDYKDLAIEHMNIYGIPASITLAQGILESGSGKSELAVNANNHFGIKCHSNWEGERSYYDDDEENECFRKYKSVKDSYLDHSLFLSNKGRYSSLFDLKVTDYKGWAKGLKKAGYATDPEYSNNLIRLIEKYYLFDFDNKKKKIKKENINVDSNSNHSYSINLCNEVPFILAKKNDSFKSLANFLDIWESELLKFNDVFISENDTSHFFSLNEGSRVYIKPKKRKNTEHSFHKVADGQTMRMISQLYAVKLSMLYKYNNLFLNRKVKEGDIIYLQKKRKN